jgi:hypothetical protein
MAVGISQLLFLSYQLGFVSEEAEGGVAFASVSFAVPAASDPSFGLNSPGLLPDGASSFDQRGCLELKSSLLSSLLSLLSLLLKSLLLLSLLLESELSLESVSSHSSFLICT